MGVIICEKHGENRIVQMSDLLHESYLNEKKESILKLIFEIKELNESFVHFFRVKDDVSQFEPIMDISVFEEEFSKISGDPGSCIICFEEYLEKHNIEIIEQKIIVKSPAVP